MRRYLTYTTQTGGFSFLDVTELELAVTATIGTDRIVRQYGLWEFPEGLELPTFSAGQITDVMNWAKAHGELVSESG